MLRLARNEAKQMEARCEERLATREKTGDLGWKVRRNPSCKVFGFKDLKVS